jgi:hypothetical protein
MQLFLIHSPPVHQNQNAISEHRLDADDLQISFPCTRSKILRGQAVQHGLGSGVKGVYDHTHSALLGCGQRRCSRKEEEK